MTTFTTDTATVPGRFNVQEMAGIQVVFHYAHNQGAMETLGQAMQSLGRRHTVTLIGPPGDRRNDDLEATIKLTLPYVDEYVFYEQRDRRGRALEEVPRLLQAAVGDKPSERTPTEEEGIRRVWDRTPTGGRLIVIADEVDEGMGSVYWATAPSTSPMGPTLLTPAWKRTLAEC